jgi:hypothetical protein
MVPLFFDSTISTLDKSTEYFIDTNYLPLLLFLNYPLSKIEKNNEDFTNLIKETKNTIIKIKIKKAKLEAKKINSQTKQISIANPLIFEKITKMTIKKPVIEENNINIILLYKFNIYNSVNNLMTDADLIHQYVNKYQDYSFLNEYKYILSGACTKCSGMLLEKDIKYAFPASKEKFLDLLM